MSSRPPFLDALSSRVLVCDGAMGTMLYGKGIFVNRCFESLNLSQPELVRDVHRGYRAAGADVLETNTFGASRMKLRAFGLGDQVHAINLAGARLAREIAGEDVYVAGAIGPLGVRIEPWGKTGVDEAREHFREQAVALAEGGVDLFILETFRDWNEAAAAVDAVKSVSTLPVVALVTTEEDGNSLDGTPPEQFGPALARRGADVVGVNCSVGPAPMLETVERLAAVVDVPLAAQPNAGKPRDIEGRNIYLCSPEYMASYARRFIAQGVRLVGGCCGTTPDHIRQIALAAKQLAPDVSRTAGGVGGHAVVTIETPHARQPVPLGEKSGLGAALAAGRFVRGAEIVPPRGHRTDDAVRAAQMLAARGLDLVMVADGPRGGARVGALALAALIHRAGIEPLLQYACRDRNLLGIQSDLLGAHAMGVRNLLGITGDVRKIGDYPDATAVFDVDSIGLTHVVSRLNHGLDIAGQPIGEPAALVAGVMVNPAARDFDRELRRFEYKVEAGAEYAVTRPIFDVDAFEQFLRRTEHCRVPILAGLWAFDSALNAEFMANEVPDLVVPSALVERMRAAASGDDARREGAKIAREISARLRPMTAGVVVTSPDGQVERALDVLEGQD